MGYAPYFLTVNSIVRYARSQDILCQGRGSAANSIICFVLGVTSIDPVKHTLLFERFISEDRHEPPDIDVDFEHERREEVIQWIYETYGEQHAALTAVVSRFRTRGALREVGKVMGLSEDMTSALAGQVWGISNEGVHDAHVDQLNLDRSDPRLALTLQLVRELVDTPRHLSQHPGGFVLARDRLDDLVPIEPAAMVDRRVVEWEKLDIEELGLMKVDILGLGMLGCMRRAFALLETRKGIALTMASPEMQDDDAATYEMIQQADTLGVFQIESRAQMSMLPRMKPEGILRSGDRGRDRPARTDPGRHGASLSQAAGRQGARHLSQPGAEGGAGENPRRAAVPGTGDAGRDGGRGVQRQRSRSSATGDGDLQGDRRRRQVSRAADRTACSRTASPSNSPNGW